MKKIIYFSLIGVLAFLASCSEEEIVPAIDTMPEYAEMLKANATKSDADAKIYEWYQKYGTAFLYDFRDVDFSWQWAGKFKNAYTKFDMTNDDDKAAVVKLLTVIENNFLALYDEDFLKNNLPYKVFLVKVLRTTSNADSKLSSTWASALGNDQDAFMIGYQQKNGKMFPSSTYETELGNVFGNVFYGNLPVKPEKFVNSRVECKYNLVTVPVDNSIAEEFKTKPEWADKNHQANVCGYIRGYSLTKVKVPTPAQDYTDYLTFITKNSGSYIRKYTQAYWRIAKRATLFMDFFLKENKQNLIELQNAAFPDDKVTMADFSYTEK